MSEYRVGTGFDAHALEEGVPLVLGGVRIEHPRGLAGHSDGDVLAHALTDALLGAAGLEDIGALFPSGDLALAGADSLGLLRQAWERIRNDGWQLANADVVTVVAMGSSAQERSEEDELGAAFIAARLRGEIAKVSLDLRDDTVWADWFPRRDAELALEVDRFAFALPVYRENGLLIARPEYV